MSDNACGEQAGVPAVSVKPAGIVLALLTWNTCEASLDSLEAHVREARLLTSLGHTAHVCVCDNGSADGTATGLRRRERTLDLPHHFIYNEVNTGNCIARNQIIDYALEVNADLLLLVDGDVEVVPFSSVAMVRYMTQYGDRLGCLGVDSAGQTPERQLATKTFPVVQPEQVQTSSLVAWTQYGMFRCQVFSDGVRFEESPPFDQPGWGFEDNDLAFQMVVRDFLIQHVVDVRYLHRHVRSSVLNLRAEGVDVAYLCARRREFVLNKWSTIARIQGPLLNNIWRCDPRI
ncbi:MAG: glycosyltransferase [Chloroflexi bacterium]|nr:glycosyltransferase [Chloroflexota bacterium]